MTQGFTCSDKETLVAYIYGECDAAGREGVERHLAVCAACAEEVKGFGAVREALAEYQPPERIAGFRLVRDDEVPERPVEAARVLRPARWWSRPLASGWARAAAAVLLFAGGAALANLDVTYRDGAVTIRTGWQPRAELAAQRPAPSPVTPAGAPGEAPWRADLVALERQLRDDFGRQTTAQMASQQVGLPGSSPTVDERRLMTRVQDLISASERRTTSEMAMRVAQVQGEFGFQRATDLARLRQGLDQIEGRAGAEALSQRQLINYILASQKK